MKYFHVPMLTLLIIFTLAGCSTNTTNEPSNQQADETTTPPSETETPVEEADGEGDEENTDSDDSSSDGETDEAPPEEAAPPAVEYYVGKHYKIYPVDESLNEEKIALLTIDDSPKDAEVTKQILEILDKHEAKALFFVNGIYVKKNPDMLLEIKERGHIIGNHTYTHPNLRNNMSEDDQRKEILDVQTQIEELTGERPIFFRPPHGANTPVSDALMKEEKMQSMNWSVGSLDWELKDPEEIKNQVLSTMHNGANILFHDKQVTADALDSILTELKSKGYSFVLPTSVAQQ